MRSNRPYVQLDPAVIEQARQMDLLSYLQRYEPNNLKRVTGKVLVLSISLDTFYSNKNYAARKI